MGFELALKPPFGEASTEPARVDATSPIWAPEFLKIALGCAEVGIWQLDMDTGLVTWDATTSTIFGLEPVAITTGALMPVHEDDQAAIWASLEASWKTGVPHDMVFRGVRRDGEIRWLHGLARPLPQQLANARFIAGVVSDVTERKLAEMALKERERELRAIVKNLPGVAYRCALEAPWPMIFVSPTVEMITGFGPADFLSGKIHYGDLIYTEDQAKVVEDVAVAVGNGSAYELRYRVCAADGVRWVRERGRAAYDGRGQPLFLEGYIEDIDDQVQAANAVREIEERHRLALEATGSLVWDWDCVADTITFGDNIGSKFGYARSEFSFSGAWWLEKVHPADRERVVAEIDRALHDEECHFASGFRLQCADGSYAEVFDRAYVVRNDAGIAVRMVGAMEDLTERNRVAAALRESQSLSRSILEASADCIKIINLDGSLRLMNNPGLRAMDLDDLEQIRGKHWESLWPAAMRATVRAAVEEARGGRPARFTGYGPTAQGTPKWWDVVVTPMHGENGEIAQLLSISRDITASRNTAEELRWASEHDALTELPNRRSFEAHLRAATIRAMENGKSFGVLLLDLDHFKHVNDTLGHAAGDHLLKTISQRLRSSLRPSDFIARLGGDEFAVILQGIDGEEDLVRAGESIFARLQGPTRFEGRIIGTSASIGGALFPRDADTALDLLKHADTALYALKEAGRGGTKMFHSYMREQMQLKATQLSLARTAISQQSLVPFFQPKVELRTGQVVGFEALLRWNHPTRGVQGPETVTEAFKEYDLASRIGEQMQTKVLRHMRAWRENGVEFGKISLNAAPAEFLRDDYAERLLARLEAEGIPAGLLEVEVTEHVFLDRGTQYVARALELLHEAGIRVSLDDFGTGYSSLCHLRDFPVDVVKIDRSFVEKVRQEPEIAAIVTAVIDLAASLSIDVVAEGIEQVEQSSFLHDAGCRYGQGYLFGRPAHADKVPCLFRARYQPMPARQ
jgi:diguanylate cyclase (GGDEF)-like protein/PAS domain S-box-containing protein